MAPSLIPFLRNVHEAKGGVKGPRNDDGDGRIDEIFADFIFFPRFSKDTGQETRTEFRLFWGLTLTRSARIRFRYVVIPQT